MFAWCDLLFIYSKDSHMGEFWATAVEEFQRFKTLSDENNCLSSENIPQSLIPPGRNAARPQQI